MNLPIYNVTLGEITGLSLVEFPAIEEDFQCFSKQVKLSYNEEKHIVFGPVIIPDKPIFRGGYYLVFGKEVIEEFFLDFMKNKVSDFNLEHSNKIANVFLLEAFIKRPGLNPEGYEDLPDGTLFFSLKVEDDNLWNRIKSGEFRGFSIEADITSEQKDELEQFLDEL